MMNGVITHRSWAALILFVAAILVVPRLPLPLLEPEEARYAEIPRQMLAHDRFLVPVRDGQDYLDKPPLLYWMVMASYRVFGVSVTAARLPTVGCAWLSVVVVLIWGWRTARPEIGLAGAGVLTLTPDFVYRAPMLTMNSPLALFVTASLAAGHLALLERRRSWWILSAAMCGLGVLTKGPVAIVLCAPLAVAPWLDRRLTRPGPMAAIGWLAVVGAIAGPWFIAVAVRTPGFVEYFFWKHHAVRFAAPFDHAGPWWQYLVQLAMGFLPWTIVAVVLGVRLGCGDKLPSLSETSESLRSLDPRFCPPALIALAAGLWAVLFFSLAGSKRPVYLVAAEPMLALAAGAFFWHARQCWPRRVWIGLSGATALTLAAGVFFWMPVYSDEFSVDRIARIARTIAPDTPVVCYGHGWDSIGFLLERNDVRTFLGDEKDDITSELAEHPRVLVFVSTRRAGDDFAQKLTPGVHVRWLAASRQARVGYTEREAERAAGDRVAGDHGTRLREFP